MSWVVFSFKEAEQPQTHRCTAVFPASASTESNMPKLCQHLEMSSGENWAGEERVLLYASQRQYTSCYLLSTRTADFLLLTAHGRMLLTLEAAGAWMEPGGLLSLLSAQAPAGQFLAQVLSPLFLHGSQSMTCNRTSHWGTRDRDQTAGSPQLQADAISQPCAQHYLSCPVTARRLAVCFWKKVTLENLVLSTIYSSSD